MSTFIHLINTLISAFASVVSAVINLLPETPFNWSFVQTVFDNQYLKLINYFIPFDFIITFMEIYLMAVAIWYLWRWVLRFVKYIG